MCNCVDAKFSGVNSPLFLPFTFLANAVSVSLPNAKEDVARRPNEKHEAAVQTLKDVGKARGDR